MSDYEIMPLQPQTYPMDISGIPWEMPEAPAESEATGSAPSHGSARGRGRGRPVRIPGFLDSLRLLRESGLDLADPSVGVVLSPDEATAFCLGHGIEPEDARRLAAGDATFEELVRGGWLARVGDFVGRLVPRARELPLEAVLTPIVEIHCPHVPGCEASYTRTRKREGAIRLNVSFRGVAAGPGLAVTTTVERKVTTVGVCKRTYVKALVSAIDWSHPLLPDRSLRIYSVEELDWYTTEQIIPAGQGHGCGRHFTAQKAAVDAALLKGWRPRGPIRLHEPSAGGGGVQEAVKVSRERFFRFDAGSVEVESRFSSVVKYAYTLPSGHHRGYLGRFPDDRSGAFQWAWL